MECEGVACRSHAGELSFDGGNILGAALESEAVDEGPGRSLTPVGHDLASQGRREELERRILVDVVLDHGVVHLNQPDQSGVHESVWWNSCRAETWLALLLKGVDPVGDDLTDVDPEQVSCQRRHHHLVGPSRVGQMSGHHGQPVLAEVQPVHADHRLDVVDRPDFGGPVRSQRGRGKRDARLDVANPGETGDGLDGRRRVARWRATPVTGATEDRDA